MIGLRLEGNPVDERRGTVGPFNDGVRQIERLTSPGDEPVPGKTQRGNAGHISTYDYWVGEREGDD